MSAENKQNKLKVLLAELNANNEYASELQQAISLIPANKVRETLVQELEIKQIIINALEKEINETKVGDME
ncbi:hypothetical protein [Bacillus sp. Marseille-P3661]|uniref:hypothetical protein n=1 Tax=Bacillus sp. Marseille-P3661 TaxID=1936234 RepID=UPI000C859C0C|nr:hypothetical protein [Bacillus sp. Marseille-P3661]